MEGPFTRRRDGGVDVRLSDVELALVRRIASELRGVLDAPERASYTVRLFPPAYRDDPDAQAEYARLMEGDLVRQKQDAVGEMLASLDRGVEKRGVWRLRLSGEEAEAWLGVLNDVRLTLGTRLDITEESYDREIDPADPDASAHEAYRYLGWLEESLVGTLMQ